jgi:FkbM family methyltransferase
MLYNPGDEIVGRSLELYGEFSEGEVEVFRQVVKPGHVVVEVGANIGAHTIFLAQQVGPKGRVIAFEPQRILFQTLCANLALNSITNVMCYCEAVGDKQGTIIVPSIDYTRACNFGGVALGACQQGESVPIVPLDTTMLSACDFIKVDVEGMEEQVLRGAAGLISRCKPVLYVENDRPEKSEGLIRYIDSLGYSMHWHVPFYYNQNNFMHNPNDVFQQFASFNMLCLPRGCGINVQGMDPVVVPPPIEPAS